MLFRSHRITGKEWKMVSEDPHLYLKLPLLDDGTKLVGYCSNLVSRYNTQFLTALPRLESVPYAREDKIEWAAKYFPGYRVNFGPKSVDKWRWSEPNAGDILIDDRISNIEDWVEKGKGIGIWYHGNLQKVLASVDEAMKTLRPQKFM